MSYSPPRTREDELLGCEEGCNLPRDHYLGIMALSGLSHYPGGSGARWEEEAHKLV